MLVTKRSGGYHAKKIRRNHAPLFQSKIALYIFHRRCYPWLPKRQTWAPLIESDLAVQCNGAAPLCQNGNIECFNGASRKECLNAELFAILTEVRAIIEKWRRRYNERRLHSSQNYITPEMAYFGVREKRKA